MKYCTKCGEQIMDEAVVCPHCGCQTELMNKTEESAVEKTNPFAIAGFVWSFFSPLFGWIFGGIGLYKSTRLNGKGRSFSIAALAVATAMFILVVVTAIAAAA